MFRNWSLLFLFLVFHGAYAQEEQPAESTGSTLADAYILFGVFFQRESVMELSDWQAQFPNSELLQNASFPSNAQGSKGRRSRHGPYTLHFGVGLDLSRNENGGTIQTKQLRLGMLHSANNSNHGSWRRSQTGPYDTLVSQLTGEMYPVDTSWTERYRAYHKFSRLGLDMAYVLLNENLSLWSWQVGVGALLGLTYNDQGSVHHSVERRIDEFSYGRAVQDETEFLRNAPSFWGGTYVIFGISRRLENTKVHLHYDARPTLLFSNFQGDVIRSMRAGGQHLLGLRVDLR